MPGTLHITNGDSAGSNLTGLGSNILVWKDVLHEGPVPSGFNIGPVEQVVVSRAQVSLHAGFQALGPRQPGLPLVKSPKLSGLEFERASYVERIQRAAPEAAHVAPRQLGTDFKGLLGKANLRPHACRAVGLEIRIHSLRLLKGHLTLENVPLNRVGELRTVQRRQPNHGFRSHPP
jgi:hypothetical protein